MSQDKSWEEILEIVEEHASQEAAAAYAVDDDLPVGEALVVEESDGMVIITGTDDGDALITETYAEYPDGERITLSGNEDQRDRVLSDLLPRFIYDALHD